MAPRVFSKVISVGSPSKPTEYPSCNISRPLFSSQSNQKITVAKLINRSKSPFSTRFHNKQRQIKFTTQSKSCIHRGSFLVSRRSGIPYSVERARTESQSPASFSGLQYRTRISSYSGKDSILTKHDSKCKIGNAPNPNASVEKLESISMSMDYQIPVTSWLKPHLR